MWWLLFAVSKMIVLNVEKSGTEEASQTCALSLLIEKYRTGNLEVAFGSSVRTSGDTPPRGPSKMIAFPMLAVPLSQSCYSCDCHRDP
jgi:hypothetical protein